jgi:hypothetical protein
MLFIHHVCHLLPTSELSRKESTIRILRDIAK